IPNSLGGFAVDNPKLTAYNNPIGIAIKAPDGHKYGISIFVYAAADEAYGTYQKFLRYMLGGQFFPIGDEAFVAPEAYQFIAQMHYSNVCVQIQRPENILEKTPTPIPLTTDQLVAVLNDLYAQVLKR